MIVELKKIGFNVGRKLVKKAYEYLGIQALYPKPKTTIANRLDYKYPYLLDKFKDNKGLVQIDKPNIVYYNAPLLSRPNLAISLILFIMLHFVITVLL